jgi:hypothetical protein
LEKAALALALQDSRDRAWIFEDASRSNIGFFTMKLEQLAPGQTLSGVEPPDFVSVVASVPQAAGSVQLIYRTSDGTMKERLLGRADETLIEIAGHERPYSFNVPQHTESDVRRSVRVLAMVGELHKRGFQRLRVMPYMAPSGLAWRCAIGSADHFCQNHGAMLLKECSFVDFDSQQQTTALIAHYSSGQENHYFGWNDSERDTARSLADKFVNRFSRVIEGSGGWDYPYAGWFLRLLGLAEAGWVAFAFADLVTVRFDFMYLSDVRSKEAKLNESRKKPALPLPPPGESQQDYRT